MLIINGKKHRTVQGMLEDIGAELDEWSLTRKSLKRMGRELSQESLTIVSGLVDRAQRLQKMRPDEWIPVDF